MTEQSNAVRTIRVTQGLFVLRYVASKAGLNAPTLGVDTANASGVDLIWPNTSIAGRLVTPGDGLVVRASRDGFITVSVTPSHRNGSRDAELVLERVSTTMLQAVPDEAGRPAAGPVDAIEILAHVARRGDVLVRSGQWICGPDLPMAIEGIEIRWPDRPDGIDIMARATVNSRGLRTLADQPTGAFLGTRGRAAPITALSLTMTGPGAKDYLLRCDALFLGLPVMTASGTSCVLRGTTGLEPLVGLRLSVIAAVEHAMQKTVGLIRSQAAEDTHATPPVAVAARTEKSNRVRIFRTSRVKPSPAYILAK